MVFAMVDKKINPASWTVPIANGNDEKIKNPNWWINEEKMSNFDNAFIFELKTGLLKITAAYPNRLGTAMIALTKA
jgi:hypothetical protein